MIELERHIEILLLSNDCVIVPGLGGFVAHHMDARYEAHDGLFLPPLRTLGFNPQLTLNDSLLAQSYADAYDISFPDAMDRINADVQTLKHQLNNEGSFCFEDLGKLYRNAEGNLAFDPFEAGILTPALYGLSSFDITVVQKPVSKTTVAEKTAASDQLESAIVEHKTRNIYISNEEGTGRRMLSISMNAIRNTAVAAVFIGVAFLVGGPMIHHQHNLNEQSVKSGVLYNVISDDSPASPPVRLGHTKSKVSTKKAVMTAHPTIQEDSSAMPEGKFSIVLCSHVPLANANAFVESLKKEGIQAEVRQGSESVKVIYGHYSSKQEAQADMNAHMDNTHFQNAWVIEFGR